jgi:hypothetical protein
MAGCLVNAIRLASSLSASCCPLRNWCSLTAALRVMLGVPLLAYILPRASPCRVANVFENVYGATM